jgi:hypothetical protein
MPQIIVTADRRSDRGDGAVLLSERVTVHDFESDHFAAQLVERLGWAVGDAHEVELQARDERTHRPEHDGHDAGDNGRPRGSHAHHGESDDVTR